MSREKRLEDILKTLYQGRRVTTKDLARKYDVNIRMIQIDLKELRQMYPIHREKGEYFIPDEYTYQDIQKTHPLAIDMAMNIVKKTLPKYVDIIQNTLDSKINDIFLFDFEIEEIKNEKIFILLKDAILENKSIKFRYIDHEKNVYPLKITNFNSYWYLMGYDLNDQIIKTFYLDNISDIVFYEESFLDRSIIEKLHRLNITSSWYNNNPQKTKLILFNEAKKYILRRTPSNIHIINNTKDSIEIEFNYFNEIEVINFIKKWIGNINILDQKLQKKVKQIFIEAIKTL